MSFHTKTFNFPFEGNTNPPGLYLNKMCERVWTLPQTPPLPLEPHPGFKCRAGNRTLRTRAGPNEGIEGGQIKLSKARVSFSDSAEVTHGSKFIHPEGLAAEPHSSSTARSSSRNRMSLAIPPVATNRSQFFQARAGALDRRRKRVLELFCQHV